VSATGDAAPAPAAMILAAGRGERMRPLTDRTPKPLLVVRGETLIERHVRACATAGIRRIVVNLWWLGGQIRERLGDGSRYGVEIAYSEEGAAALETAGGIVRALPLLGNESFIVVNGDIYTDYPLAGLRLGEAADAHLVLVPNPPQHPGGDFGLTNRRVLAAAAQRFTFAGIALYRRGMFAACADGVRPLKPLLVAAMERDRCTGEIYQGLWEDVGTPARLAALNRP
jgi:MurNAc alpha-1-phosphate uridylyltransferase